MYTPKVSSIVMSRPHLLDNYIRAQFTDVLLDTDCDEYSREERAEAHWYVVKLAQLRHENAGDTLQSILND